MAYVMPLRRVPLWLVQSLALLGAAAVMWLL